MPSYRCSECGEYTAVRNTRGSRIKDRACSTCGRQGTLQGATAGRASPNAGRSYENCAACDRRGLKHGHPAFAWEPKHRYDAHPGPFPAGSPACWVEEAVPAARTREAAVRDELRERLGGESASWWATEDEQRQLGLRVGEEAWSDPRLCEECVICGSAAPADREDAHTHAILAYRFERGVAALLFCERCGHTRLIAERMDVVREGQHG